MPMGTLYRSGIIQMTSVSPAPMLVERRVRRAKLPQWVARLLVLWVVVWELVQPQNRVRARAWVTTMLAEDLKSSS